MALIDRLARDNPQPPAGVDHISNHAWSAAMWFLAKGEITQAQVISAFSLSAEDQIQFQQLVTFYGTLNATDKGQFHNRVESAGVLLEVEYITRAKYKTLLGMT